MYRATYYNKSPDPNQGKFIKNLQMKPWEKARQTKHYGKGSPFFIFAFAACRIYAIYKDKRIFQKSLILFSSYATV